MVVELIRADDDNEVIPWAPMSFDLLAAARQELLREREQPRRTKPPLNPDRLKESRGFEAPRSPVSRLDRAREIAETIDAMDRIESLDEADRRPATPPVAAHDTETLNALREQVRVEGYQAGYDEGHREGKETGHSEGHKTGYYAGYEEGSQKGYEEGHEKGFAEATETGKAEGFSEGHQTGYAEGYEKGLREGSETALEQSRKMTQIFNRFTDNIVAADQDLAEDLLALAIQIADSIVTTALEVQPELLLPVVRQAIQTLPQTNQQTRILLNPEDVGMVEGFLNEQGLAAACTIVADGSIETGGCRIETGSALVDATVANRRERVLGSIGLYRDWIEKRKL